MKLLYGTGNAAKIKAMSERLKPLGIELLGLREMGQVIPDIVENGDTPLENARKKAYGYFEAFHIPVFSCDSGLYFENVPKEEQPGVHVRTVQGKYLTDDEMLEHYSALARKYGTLKAKYCNAICFVQDEQHVYEAMDPDMESEPFYLVETPHVMQNPGFPLDSLSVHIETGRYYYDLSDEKLKQVAVEDGFLRFFQEIFV